MVLVTHRTPVVPHQQNVAAGSAVVLPGLLAAFVVVGHDGSVPKSGSCRSSSNPGNNGQLILIRPQAIAV